MHINESPNREHILSAAQQLKKFHPEQIWFFTTSDFNPEDDEPNMLDFCVVMDTAKKTETMAYVYSSVLVDVPFGILLYTPSEWEKHYPDPGSFANYIKRTGTLLYKNKELINEHTISAISEASELDPTEKSFKTTQDLMDDLEKED